MKKITRAILITLDARYESISHQVDSCDENAHVAFAILQLRVLTGLDKPKHLRCLTIRHKDNIISGPEDQSIGHWSPASVDITRTCFVLNNPQLSSERYQKQSRTNNHSAWVSCDASFRPSPSKSSQIPLHFPELPRTSQAPNLRFALESP